MYRVLLLSLGDSGQQDPILLSSVDQDEHLESLQLGYVYCWALLSGIAERCLIIAI